MFCLFNKALLQQPSSPKFIIIEIKQFFPVVKKLFFMLIFINGRQ